MALTNFTDLTIPQKKVWSRMVWNAARNNSFLAQFIGKGPNSMIQHITELTKTERGDAAIFQLVADLIGDGIAGDNLLEGNEEAMQAYGDSVQIDQLRHAVRSEGKLAAQKTVVNFREQAKDKLGYWLGERLDQILFLTMSGIPLSNTNKGATRPGATFGNLAFNGDISAPTANRHCHIDDSGNLVTTYDATAITANSTLNYNALVDLKAYAKDTYLRGIRGKGGEEYYHVFVTPKGLAQLKKDTDFKENLRHADLRGSRNPIFKGADSFIVDGLIIHEARNVFTNENAGAGNYFGAAGAVKGQRMLLCGAQSLAMADIGAGEWNEDTFDYGNQGGIEYGKIFGVKKPKFNSIYTGAVDDFGVIAVDTAI